MPPRITACFALPFFLHAVAFLAADLEPQPTDYGRTLNELINSFRSDAPKAVTQDTCPEVCAGERCEVHGNPLVKGVAPVYYGLFKSTDEKGLALDEAAERFFPHAKVKVYGGCVEKKAKEERVCYCPWCRLRLEKWLKAPTYVTRPRPIVAAYEDIEIGMEMEELLKLMAPYRKLHSEHGQWQTWVDGHISLFVTCFRKVGSKQLSEEFFDSEQNCWVWERVEDRPSFGIFLGRKKILETLTNMPTDIDGDYWTCLEADCARVAARSADLQKWKALEKATKQASVGLRMQLLENVGRRDFEERPETQRRRRLAFLASYLDDADVRDSSSEPNKYSGFYAGYAYKPHLAVRNLVALKMADFFNIEVERNPSRTGEEWAQLRNKVREDWKREQERHVKTGPGPKRD